MKDPVWGFSTYARWVGLIGLLSLVALGAGAREVQSSVSLDDPPDLAALPSEADAIGLKIVDGKIELTLEDAVGLTLERNLSLVVDRYQRSQAIQGIEQAFGIFDLNLGSTLSTSESTFPVTTTLEETDEPSITSENITANFNLSQLTTYGGTAQFQFNNSRNASNNRAQTFNPRFNTSVDFSFTQPLLRNFGRETTYNSILVARNTSSIAHETFKAQVEAVVQRVSDQYWLLVQAREQLKVAQESLELAKELHEMNRIQVEVGTMAPLETVRSEAGVATREEQIISNQADVEDASDVLHQLLNLDNQKFWGMEIVPVTDPITDYVPIDFDEAYAKALANRTDIQTQILTNKNRELSARFQRNQKKPRLDLSAGYGFDGVGGDLAIFDRDGSLLFQDPGNYGDAFQQVLDGDSTGWFVQAVFAYPLQNRAAKARSLQADLLLEQGELEMADLEQQVLLQVRALARASKTAEQQIESAKVSTKLQRKNLEAEQKRYENGLSTSFEVLQIQEDLTEALSREVSAITAYRRALNALYLATGTILDEVGVELVDDAADDDAATDDE